MSGLARLGHVARGVNAGIMDFQQMQANERGLAERKRRMSLADADAQWTQQLRGRQQQQWQREDDTLALEQEARAAGMKAIDEDRAAYDNAPAPLGLDGKPGAKAPYSPSKKAILRAAQAQQDIYFRKGRADLGIAMDAKLEPLRATLKGEAANGVMNAMRTGKDITAALREFDALNNDGFDIDGDVQSVQQPDGSTAYRVKRKNRFSGKTMEQVVSQRSLVEAMASNIGKPEDAAKFNQSLLLEAFKSKNDREERTHTTNEAIRADSERTKNDLRVVGARGAEDRKTNAAKDGGDDGSIKTLTQANRAVETARNALHQARQAAIEVRLKNDKMERKSPEERAAAVAADPEVKQAQEEYQRALGVRNRLASGGKAEPEKTKRIRLDAQGNIVKD